MKNKLIVISGCSGGGKSTLLSELANMGYSIVPEIGREVVKDQLNIDGTALPWKDAKSFCELLIKKSIDAYHQANQMYHVKHEVIFFDRSFIDGISWYQSQNYPDNDKYNYFINELKFYSTVFMVPPWKEIFSQDEERKHTFEDAINEYNRLMIMYPKYGYQISIIPKTTVKERIDFLLSKICEDDN